MKKTVSILLIIAMLLAAILAIMSVNAAGDVTPEPQRPDGTVINDLDDYMKYIVNGETDGKVFYLNIDIYQPLSDFKGTLYGNGHVFETDAIGFENIDGATIKDLKIVSTSTSTVFGDLNNVTLENLEISARSGSVIKSLVNSTVKNVSITLANGGSSVFGSEIRDSVLEDISAAVATEMKITKSMDFGGLATKIEDSSLKNVSCDYSVKASGFKVYSGAIGGICSTVAGDVTFQNVSHAGEINLNTWADVDATVNEKNFLGGLIGKTAVGTELTIDGCLNAGDLFSTQSGTNVGGILGYAYNTNLTIKGCGNLGNISTMSASSSVHVGAGGIIGFTNNMSPTEYYVTISGCENRGRIFETDREDVFNAFCEASFTEYNNANKDKEGFVAVDAEGYKEVYLAEYVAEYLAENVGKTEADALEDCLKQSKFSSITAVYGGGIMGRVFAIPYLYINSCKNYANIEFYGTYGSWGGAAGIVASFVTIGNWEGIAAADIRVVNCYNEGKIVGNQPAGILGGKFMQLTSNNSKLVVEYCINRGEIVGRAGGRAAGIVCDFDSQGGADACNLSDINIRNCANYGNISGATVSGGIVSSLCNQISITKAMSIVNCYNAGNISTVNYMVTENKGTEEEEVVLKEASMAGGIIATVKLHSVIANCVNVGTVSAQTKANAFPIVDNEALVLASDNVHLGKGTFTHSTGKTSEQIEAIVAKMVFEKINNTASLEAAINIAQGLVDIDYSKESWKVFSSAFEVAKKVVNSVTATQETVDLVEKNLTEAINGLEQIPADIEALNDAIAEGVGYYKDDWDDYSFLNLAKAIEEAVKIINKDNVLQSEVNTSIDAIKTAISNLEERGELITLETVVDLTVGGLYDTNPAGTQGATDVEGNSESQGEGETDPTDNDGGCGSIIGGAAVVLVAAAAIGIGVTFKKKED